MKATNTEVINLIDMGHDTYYRIIKKYPKVKILFHKGVIADKMINKEVLEALIKQKKD